LKKVDNLDCIMKGFETYEN